MKLAVITGGTRGLGLALTREMAGRGFTVLALYRHDDETAAKAASDRVAVLKCDITTADVEEKLGGHALVDACEQLVLVNNACAAFEPRPFHRTTIGEFQEALRVSVDGSVRCVQALLRPLAARRGTIVNVLSESVQTIPKGFSPYLTAKYALLGLTKSLKAELSPQGVRVLAVAPRFMDTDLTRAWDARLRSAYAGGTTRSPDETAHTIVDLIESTAVADQDVHVV